MDVVFLDAALINFDARSLAVLSGGLQDDLFMLEQNFMIRFKDKVKRADPAQGSLYFPFTLNEAFSVIELL